MIEMNKEPDLNSANDNERPCFDQAGLVAFLTSQPDVVAAYLFGSLAQGRPNPRSDVDIAILLNPASAEKAFERQSQLTGDLERFADTQVDVVMLGMASSILQHQVLRYGRLLHERDRRARVEFEVRAGAVYADLKPMRDFFTDALLLEIREVGLGGRRRRHRQSPEAAR